MGPLRLALLLMKTNTTISGAAQAGPPQNAKTQRAAILRLMIEARVGWVASPEIAERALQYHARLFELRKLVFVIENKTETDETRVRRSWFPLISSPRHPWKNAFSRRRMAAHDFNVPKPPAGVRP